MQNVANMSLFQRRLFIEQDIVNWTAIVPLPLPCISNWIILVQRSKRSFDSEASGRPTCKTAHNKVEAKSGN